MKILLVNDFKAKNRGAELYNYNLKKLLEKEGHNVRLFGAEENFRDNVKAYFYSWYNIKEKKRISQVLDDFKPEIVQCHNLFGYLSPSILLEIKKRKIPIVMKIGDVRLFCPKLDLTFDNMRTCEYGYSMECITTGCLFSRKGLKKKIHSFVYFNRLVLNWHLIRKYVDAFVVPSYFIGSYLKNFVNKPVHVIRNPLFWTWSSQVDSKSTKPKKILLVGNLSYFKGVQYIIQAFGSLKDDYPDINLEIVGDGADKESLIGLAKSNNTYNKTSFAGNLPHKEVKEKFNEAYVFVLPSVMAENSPLTILEAMSQGTPVITTNLGGQRELVQDGRTGFLANPKDSNDLAEKVEAILHDKKLHKKMSRNCITYAERFSPEEHVKEIDTLFESVLHKK